MTLKAHRLKPGDTIAVIAPAGPVDPGEMRPGLEHLDRLGYRVLPAPHLYDRKAYLAGEDRARLDDLHAAFRDPRVNAVICARGGYGIHRLLPGIRYPIFRKNPKILAGYSDITALILSVYRKTGLVTFHGPMLRECAGKSTANLDGLIRVISSKRPFGVDLRGSDVLRKGRAEGTLIGGNLSLISHLVGTGYLPNLRGAILFLEDVGEPLYRIDRMLNHLRLCGYLKKVSGIVAGRFEDSGDPSAIRDLLLEAVSGLRIPVVHGAPFGHGPENQPLPVGIHATLDTHRMTLRWAEAPVE